MQMEHDSRYRVFPEAQGSKSQQLHTRPHVHRHPAFQRAHLGENTELNPEDHAEGFCYRFRASRRLFCNNKLISLFTSMFHIRKLIFSKEGRRNKYFRSGYLRLASLQGIPNPVTTGELAPPFCAIFMGNEVLFDPVTREEGRNIEKINHKKVQIQEVPLELSETAIRNYFGRFGAIKVVTLCPPGTDSPSRSVVLEFENIESALLVEGTRTHWIDAFKVIVAKRPSTKLIDYSTDTKTIMMTPTRELVGASDESEEVGEDDLGEEDQDLSHDPETNRNLLVKTDHLALYSPSSQFPQSIDALSTRGRVSGTLAGITEKDRPFGHPSGAVHLFGLPARRIVLPFPSNTKVVLDKSRSPSLNLAKLALSSVALPTRIEFVDEGNSSPNLFGQNYILNVRISSNVTSKVALKPTPNRKLHSGL